VTASAVTANKSEQERGETAGGYLVAKGGTQVGEPSDRAARVSSERNGRQQSCASAGAANQDFACPVRRFARVAVGFCDTG